MSAPDFPLLYALRGRPVLLQFWKAGLPECQKELETIKRLEASWATQGLQVLTVNVDKSDDVTGIYNTLYRYLFDRHCDLRFPTSFLIDEKGDIVKLYQGPVNSENVEQDFRHIPQTTGERLRKALPFPGCCRHL